MMSIKMERVLNNLSSHYMPFTLLSSERLSEVVNVVRFMELRQGEILQLRGGKANDGRESTDAEAHARCAASTT